MNNNITLEQYIDTFQPHITLLFLRHPDHNVASLRTKFYAPVAGRLVSGT